MRPPIFTATVLRRFLRKMRIATLPQLKELLGTQADITVFRKLKELSYRTSYSHRGRFYTLDEIADFDEQGLWSFKSVWFSRFGTLVDTAERYVTQQGKIARQTVSGLYLYCAHHRETRQSQLLARQQQLALPTSDISPAPVSEELRAAIVLFVSLLDEQQRRLYAGLESLQRGGDRQIAELLHMDPHTVAKGRQQLLAQEVEWGRVRSTGGGRKPTEKKRPG